MASSLWKKISLKTYAETEIKTPHSLAKRKFENSHFLNEEDQIPHLMFSIIVSWKLKYQISTKIIFVIFIKSLLNRIL